MSQTDDWMMKLDPSEFNKLLNGPLSYRAIYKPASLCPCEGRGGGADPNCPNCQGYGYTWAEPTLATHTASFYHGSRSKPERIPHAPPIALETVTLEGVPTPYQDLADRLTLTPDGALVWDPPLSLGEEYSVTYTAAKQLRVHAQAFKANRAWLDRGLLKTGDLDVSIPHTLPDLATESPAWHAKEHDVFVFPDQRIRFQQRLERRKPTQRLTYRMVRAVHEARALVAGNLVTYQPGEDFIITDHQVQWLTPTPPENQYVLEYDAAPEAYVFAEELQTRHIDGHPLPRRVALRRLELYPFAR